MRVAVCVSGAIRTGHPKGCFIKNNKIQKTKFPEADFYYATWDSYKDVFKKNFPGEKCEYFSEPIMHYHPYSDIIGTPKCISEFYAPTFAYMKKHSPKNEAWALNSSKQILIHFWLADKVKDEYDIIVRTRFDAFIHKNATFESYIKDTFKNHRVNGFSATKKHKFDKINQFDSTPGKKHSKWILDQLIIHSSDVINVDYVNRLHEEKTLHGGETGWYQTLSMPYGSNHRDHDGWVAHDKSVLNKFLFEKTQK